MCQNHGTDVLVQSRSCTLQLLWSSPTESSSGAAPSRVSPSLPCRPQGKVRAGITQCCVFSTKHLGLRINCTPGYNVFVKFNLLQELDGQWGLLA